VADVLRPALVTRAEGELLPAENDLAADFAVSRNTVREALDLLRREGLIDRIPGVGTVVTTARYDHSIDTLAGLAETLTGSGEVRNVVRERRVVPAPAAVAGRLGLEPGAAVVYVERLRLADGQPLSLDQTYLVPDLGEALREADLAGQDVFALLEQTSGRRLGGASIALEAGSADEHTAGLLGVRPGAPLLLLERLTHLEDGRPVDLEFIRFRGDRMTMRGTLQRLHPPIVLPTGARVEEVSA
jgi:GntR family transcriptional regulator